MELLPNPLSGGTSIMIAYEFYWPDPVKEYDLLGILPERRKDAKKNNLRIGHEMGENAFR